MSAKNIFLCHRLGDAQGYADRLFDRLNATFSGRIFRKVGGIIPSADLDRMIQDSIGSCDVMIAIIGRYWLTMTDPVGRRRLDYSNDYVRNEIATAIQRRMPVIPVLVQGARMPMPEELPRDIARLAMFNALEISETDFDQDFDHLVRALESVLKTKAVQSATQGLDIQSDMQSSAVQSAMPSFVEAAAERLTKLLKEGKKRLEEGLSEVGLVFLCYAREDQDFALRLATAVKERGVKIWVDQWDIPASADWDQSIDEALFSCDRFLIVLSPSALGSNEVRTELRTALDEKKCIVPVLYQQCRIPRTLRLTQHINFISAAPDDETRIAQLLHGLKQPK